MRFYSGRNKALQVGVLCLVMALLGFAAVLYAAGSASIYSNRTHQGKLAVRFLGLNDLGVNKMEKHRSLPSRKVAPCWWIQV